MYELSLSPPGGFPFSDVGYYRTLFLQQSKSNKPMRTGQLYSQDSGSSVTTLHAFRFDCIKNVAAKRTPTLRPTLVNPTTKNPKHATVLAENGERMFLCSMRYYA